MVDIVIVNNQIIVRNGIKYLLEGQGDFKVVAEAQNGKELFEHLENGINADIILTEVNDDGISHLTMVKKILEILPNSKLVVFSGSEDGEIIELIEAGADGYLLNTIMPDELIFALKQVIENKRYFCMEIVDRFVERIIKIPTKSVNSLIVFTSREVEILNLLSTGLTNKEISDKLFTSRRTVEGHRHNLLNKTKCKNTSALIKYAIQNLIIV